jgi:hypothetical protein
MSREIVVARSKLLFPVQKTNIKEKNGCHQMLIPNEDVRTEGASLWDRMCEILGCTAEQFENVPILLHFEETEGRRQLRAVFYEDGIKK